MFATRKRRIASYLGKEARILYKVSDPSATDEEFNQFYKNKMNNSSSYFADLYNTVVTDLTCRSSCKNALPQI